MVNITRFQVTKLHGYKSFDLRFADNTIILVGENGAGKTTVLQLLFYFLSGQWSALQGYNFDSLSITIDGSNYQLKHDQLEIALRSIDRFLVHRMPPRHRQRFLELIDPSRDFMFSPELESLCDRYGIPFHLVMHQLELEPRQNKESKVLNQLLKKIQDRLGSQILYLPTYRRIEKELELILEGIEEDPRRRRKGIRKQKEEGYSFIELIEFGMRDVESAIQETLDRLKEFARESLNRLTLGYLGDVVEQKYDEVDFKQINSAPDQTIRNVLDRIQENILSKQNKNHLFQVIQGVKQGNEQGEHAKVICHYFLKLLSFQEDLESREAQIQSFCLVCNQYMQDKTFQYDSSTFEFRIVNESGLSKENPISLRDLSSGEKQIVSLFSHLYLSEQDKFFVLIDEPELSLSVPWQRRFLSDIKKSKLCSGLVAVTHSPFTYDNELKPYARSLGEFLKESRR